MRIALDAMGGDYAPSATVEGAIKAVNSTEGLSIILVGDKKAIQNELARRMYPHSRISIQHASEVVGMEGQAIAAVGR